ncbi:hypothetical protein CSB95_0161 [Pseudomonas aeruginosa]|nr:hypothetical protein CSC26_2530 [Pseudomonas aeruginosa]AWF58965.1 hypothetical protein CSC30_1058 [Pseudomonas aeruginosa]PRW04801.1 hypothetical protein CSB88_2799 [Pseudomonas aeruginosa]PRW06105.1 hypothetical protein CSB95_0161 [Pseudomonas aeruginosa]PRW28250.1 hypothetical protein CSB96_4186 [Pseudomonas aeruginosa]
MNDRINLLIDQQALNKKTVSNISQYEANRMPGYSFHSL